jgi:general nucleoside transport system permease protein
MKYLERRLTPDRSRRGVVLRTAIAVALALAVGALLFLPFGADPVEGYRSVLVDAFFSQRGLGYTLAKTAPLMLVGLATLVAWRSGFAYLGFEGCLLIGAAATTAIALAARGGHVLDGAPAALVWLLCALGAFSAGGAWAGLVGWMGTRFGGNEVLMSLMTNYLAVLLLQYLVSGPMRADADLPQSPALPHAVWLPYLAEDFRGHVGILLALACMLLVGHLMRDMRLGYELMAAGLNPRAARCSGIAVERRILLAAFLSGGLAALAGLSDILGVQHRLVGGMSEGTGFIGIVVALLGHLSAFGVAITSFLYAGMTVGADTMQRHSGVPSSLVVIVQALIVMFILAIEVFSRYRWITPRQRRASKALQTEALN